MNGDHWGEYYHYSPTMGTKTIPTLGGEPPYMVIPYKRKPLPENNVFDNIIFDIIMYLIFVSFFCFKS